MWSDADLAKAKRADIPKAMWNRRGLLLMRDALLMAARACEFWEGDTSQAVSRAMRAAAGAIVE